MIYLKKGYELTKWPEIKKWVDTLTPAEIDRLSSDYMKNNFDKRPENIQHEINNKTHNCFKEIQTLRKGTIAEDAYPQCKYEVQLIWTYCNHSPCNGIRWKKIMAWNSLDNVAYERILLRPGE